MFVNGDYNNLYFSSHTYLLYVATDKIMTSFKIEDILVIGAPSSLSGKFQCLNQNLSIIQEYNFVKMVKTKKISDFRNKKAFDDSVTILVHLSRMCQMIIVWSHLCEAYLNVMNNAKMKRELKREVQGWVLYRMRLGIEQIDNGSRYSLKDPHIGNDESGIIPGKKSIPKCYGDTGCSFDDFASKDRDTRPIFFEELYCKKSLVIVHDQSIHHLIYNCIEPFIREAIQALRNCEADFKKKPSDEILCKDPMKYWYATLPFWFGTSQWMEVIKLLNSLKSLNSITIASQTWEPKVTKSFSNKNSDLQTQELIWNEDQARKRKIAMEDVKCTGKATKGNRNKSTGKKNDNKNSHSKKKKLRIDDDDDEDDSDLAKPTFLEGIFMNGLASALESIYPDMVKKNPRIFSEIKELPAKTWDKMIDAENQVLSFMGEYTSLQEDLCGDDVEKLKVWMGHLKYCFCLHLGFLIHPDKKMKKCCYCPFSKVNDTVITHGKLRVNHTCSDVASKSPDELLSHMQDKHVFDAFGHYFNCLLHKYFGYCYGDTNGMLSVTAICISHIQES